MKINQHKVEKAVGVLERLQSDHYSTGFPNEMKGDISSFGASIIQAGLLPSVLFFSEGDYAERPKGGGKSEDKDTKNRRAKLMKVIYDVLETGTAQANSRRPLLDYVRQNLGSADALERITEAALAVKIALRAFKFKDQVNSPQP